MAALAFIVGLLAGGAGGLLLAALRARAGDAERAGLTARLDERVRRGQELEAELARTRRDGERNAAAAAELLAERRAGVEKLALLAVTERKLRETFEALSAEALRHNNQAFLDLARSSLGEIHQSATHDLAARQKAIDDVVAPVRESLGKVDRKLHDLERDRAGAEAALAEQLRALHADASALARALRTPHVRGRWGEIQLRRVVELAGMLEHCDFLEQPSVKSDDGRLRPDLVIRVAGGRSLVVDAKASCAAYLEAFEASDDAVRKAKLAEHARQVKDHLTRLSAKSYFEQFHPSPEMVILFLPGEAFFSAALEQDPELIAFGAEHRVLLASPITLIALLRAAAYGWREERLAEGAAEVSRLGRELYDRLRVFAVHFDDVRKDLDRAVHAYNRAAGSLENRVLASARRFQDLGAGTAVAIGEARTVDTVPRLLRPERRVSPLRIAPDGDADREVREKVVW